MYIKKVSENRRLDDSRQLFFGLIFQDDILQQACLLFSGPEGLSSIPTEKLLRLLGFQNLP